METAIGKISVSLFLIVTWIIILINPVFAAPLDIIPVPYNPGDTLTAVDLNKKFGDVQTMMNLNNNLNTLSDLSCASGEVAKWGGSAWACAADTNTDSAGVGFASSDLEFQISDLTSTIQSVTINVPGPGLVVVSFSAYYRMNHVSTSADQLEVGIAESSNATISSLPSRRFLFLGSSFPSGDFYGSVASHAVFTIGQSGTYTYYVLGYSNKATASTALVVGKPATQAVFVPNNYTQ